MTDLEKALAEAGITDSDTINDLIKSHSSAEVSDTDILDEAAALIVKAMEADELVAELDEDDEDDAEKAHCAGTGKGMYKKGAHDSEEDEEKAYGMTKKGAHDDDDEDAEKGYHKKGMHDDDEDEDEVEKSDYDLVAIISKGADMVLESVEQQNGALTKGFFAIRDAHKGLRKSVETHSGRLDSIEGKIDSLIKALGQPVPPRGRLSADDVDVVQPMAKGGISAMELIAKAKSRISESTDSAEQRRLAMAVAELDSGMNPQTVASRYGIV